MSRRLYFLVPDTESCRKVVADLVELGIPDRQLHVIGNLSTPLEGLHEASFLQRSDFQHGVRMGLGLGGIAGLIGGLLAVTFPPAGLVLGGGALLAATTLLGAGGGAVVAGMVASDMRNSQLREFEDSIAAGDLLMLVDVPRSKVEAVTSAVRLHHPEAVISVSPHRPQLA